MSEIVTCMDKQVELCTKKSKMIFSLMSELIQNSKPFLNGERYLTDKELSLRLKISRRTLQDWRSNGKIEYIQLEGKILYAESAVQKMLERHIYQAWE